MRFYEVLGHAAPFFIHHAQIVLCESVSLLGGFAVPCHGIRIALRHAVPLFIHHGQIALRISISVLGGFVDRVNVIGTTLSRLFDGSFLTQFFNVCKHWVHGV